jgi:HEAT repeat protein
MLEGGDRRSIGRVDEVVRSVIKEPKRFRALVDGLLTNDEVVRMRCADAIEKVAHARPDWLKRYTNFFLGHAAGHPQQEVCWHMAQIMPLLPLTSLQRTEAIRLLMGYLEYESGIVRVSAMQALAELSRQDLQLGERIAPLIRAIMKNGTPAVRARGRRLLGQLEAERRKDEPGDQ